MGGEARDWRSSTCRTLQQVTVGRPCIVTGPDGDMHHKFAASNIMAIAQSLGEDQHVQKKQANSG